MSNGRNVRKKRDNKKQEYSLKKISIAVVIFILLIILIICIVVKALLGEKNNQISYNKQEYEYFVLYGLDNRTGVINKNGNEIIKTKYNEIYIPNESKDVFFCYDEKGDYIILNERGEEIFTEYEEVSLLRTSDTAFIDFEAKVLKYKENEKYGLIDLDGYKLTEPIYQSISSLKNKPGAILVKKDDKYGVLDSNGNIIIDLKYDDIIGDGYCSQTDDYNKTGYITKIKTNSGDIFGYIDYKGNIIIDTKYESIERVLEYEDNEVYLICMDRGKKGVYKDKKRIISLEYQNIFYSDTSNIFIVQKGNKYGFYNNSGKKILDSIYEEYSLAGNYICVNDNGVKTLYDINGNALNNINYISMIETENPEYFIAQKENGDYCIISKSIIVDENFSYLSYAFDDYFIFTDKEGKYGVWQVWQGNVVLAEYEYILNIEGANALEAKKFDSDETDIYSKNMEIVSTISRAIVDRVDENYSVIYSDNEKIYINNDGEVVNNIEIYPNNQIYSIKQDGKWGFSDRNGNIIVDCIYDFVTELNGHGYAAVATQGVWGVIDKEGKIVVEPSYKLDTYYMPEFIGKYKIEQTDTIHCIELKGE
ncbi:MAG: WG repeat-containing protein [Candidatus Scatovivens sp.]